MAEAEKPSGDPWMDEKDVPLILGDGSERDTLEALVSDLGLEQDVRMPGFAGNPYAYMRRADVFVLSSRWEGLPTVLIEAMACGAPLVSTDCPSGAREILEDGKWGLLVPISDPEAMAQAIVQVLDVPHPPPVESWQRFTYEVVGDQYLRLLLGQGGHC
jgi:glycosyltransferase involved in cell wall biosynthesis